MSDQNTRFEELPESWQLRVRELRREAAKLRHERNEARSERDEARAARVALATKVAP